jgi:hypothetical protein
LPLSSPPLQLLKMQKVTGSLAKLHLIVPRIGLVPICWVEVRSVLIIHFTLMPSRMEIALFPVMHKETTLIALTLAHIISILPHHPETGNNA